MAICTVFGHRDCPQTVKPQLRQILSELITKKGVELFYVGNHGQFDAYVCAILKELSILYPHIRYAVVLAYMPGTASVCADYADTMLPEGIEAVHPRYAICWRNRWMLQQSDFVVTYITHPWGGAAQYAKKARALHKHLIKLKP